MKIYISTIFFALIFISCGGSTTTTSTTNTKIAYFYDSVVNGVQYKCGNNISGITGDADSNSGSFRYQDTCTVSFYVGKIHLGEINGNKITADSKIFPTNIVNVNTTDSNNEETVNILRFIQTLDDDNNTQNGIQISQTVRNNLNLSTTNTLDLTRTGITDILLQDAITSANAQRTLITKVKAIAHFEENLRIYVDPNIDTVPPAKPYISNTITAINNTNTTNIDFYIHGENNSKIFIAFNSDGNISNLNFVDYNTTIGSNRSATVNLSFNNNNISYYHYFIKLQDNKGHISEYLHMPILRDIEPPTITNTNLVLSVLEQQHFIQNIGANDTSKIIYRVVDSNVDSFSTDFSLFQIDTNGSVTFINEPDYDNNINAKFKVVIRAIDEAGNKTDVYLTITLTNILDNPPTLTNTNYSKSLLETDISGTTIYDLNTTLEHNLSISPDNDPLLSPINFILHNHTTKFDLNNSTGILTIKNSADDLFDFEKLPNSVDLNISVENNNTSNSGNKTYLNLNVSILNKIDTTPKLIIPSPIIIDEHGSSGAIYSILKNTTLSDRNLDMNFTILNNDGNFTIDTTSGVISTTGDTLDYEKKTQHILNIRATNTWFDNSSHFDDINLTININDVIDNAPSIKFVTQVNTIPESTIANFTVATIETNGTIFDQNQTTSYSIINNTTPFKININTGTISTSRQLLNDYNETESNNSVTVFSLNIKATNTWWNNSLNDSNILVKDINITNVIDNAPILLNPNSNISFDENTSTPIGSSLYTIQKNGINFDTNITTSFNIVSGNNENKFDLNSTTGEIKLNNLFDWETTTSYSLTINAQNTWWNGTEHNSSNIILNIDINNTIEKPPKIYAPSVINVHENTDALTILTRLDINSTEIDEQTINSLTIVSGNDGNFSINPINTNTNTNLKYGELTINGNINNRGTLNFDINYSYTLDINATNDFGSSTHSIQVNIIDDINTDLNLLVILIEYSDINITTPYADIDNLLFSTGSGITDKPLINYFSRVSKNKFTFKAAAETFYTFPATNGIIVTKLATIHPSNSEPQLKQDIITAINNADLNVSFINFDKDGDGNITNDELQVLYIVAGGERAYGDTNQSINAITGSFSTLDPNLILDGKKIKTNYTAVGELINSKPTTIGLIAKFLSETLFGFNQDGNNNYNYNYFDIMGEGFKGHESNETLGRTPVHPSIVNKMKQGWVTPKVLYTSSTIDFYNTHDNINFNAIRVNTSDVNIYYLIENRNQANGIGANINYDDGLYGKNDANLSGGLVIWEVDDNLNKVKIIQMSGSGDSNIFNPLKTTIDLGIIKENTFNFNNIGTIDLNTKIYNIGINKQ